MDRVQLVDEIVWGFRDQGGTAAFMYPKSDHSRYGSGIGVDPFPGYSHDLDVVRETLDRVSELFPLPEPFAPMVFVLTHETLSRTNAQAGQDFDYDWKRPDDDPNDDEETQRPWRGTIVLQGKRIPPHPAMTRYLVGHEYGHIVEDWLIRGRRERIQSQELLHEYADRRGLRPSEFVMGASGGTWHRAIQEIFACDFRIVRCGLEEEFWPHPGIERPPAAVVEWWGAQS